MANCVRLQEQSNLFNWFDILVAAKNLVAESNSYSSEGMAHKKTPIRALWSMTLQLESQVLVNPEALIFVVLLFRMMHLIPSKITIARLKQVGITNKVMWKIWILELQLRFCSFVEALHTSLDPHINSPGTVHGTKNGLGCQLVIQRPWAHSRNPCRKTRGRKGWVFRLTK